MTEKLQKEPAENTRFQGKSTFRFLKSLSSLMSREEYSYATLNLAKTRCLLEDATQPRYVLLILTRLSNCKSIYKDGIRSLSPKSILLLLEFEKKRKILH